MNNDFDHPLRFYIECRCKDRCHLLRLEYDNESGLTLEVVPHEAGQTFWQKLKECVAYLFCRRQDVCCNASMIDQAGAAQLQAWLNAAWAQGFGSDWEPKK